MNRNKREEKKQVSQQRWIPGKAYDGLEYSVQVMQGENGSCVAPIFKKGARTKEERDTYQAMKACVQGWMKNSEHKIDFQLLKAQGFIIEGRVE